MNLEHYRVQLAATAAISAPLVVGVWRFLDPNTPIAITYYIFAAWLAITACLLLATRISTDRLFATIHMVGVIWWLTVIAARLFEHESSSHAQDTLTADVYLVLALLIVIASAVLPIARATQVTIGIVAASTLLIISWALLPSTIESDPAALGIALAFQASLVVIALMTHVLAHARSERDTAVDHATKLRTLADHDALTGLPNRRYLETALTRQLALSQRHGTAVSVLYIDVDHFKKFNDGFGHAAGDDALAHIGTIMRQQLRASDHYGRWGGEEFLAILGDDAASALMVAERLRHAVATNPGPSQTTVTISIGVATSSPSSTLAELVDSADQRLYEAKRLGRNRVVGPDTAGRPTPARGTESVGSQAK